MGATKAKRKRKYTPRLIIAGIPALPSGNPASPGGSVAMTAKLVRALTLGRLLTQQFTGDDFNSLLKLLNTSEWIIEHRPGTVQPGVVRAAARLREGLRGLQKAKADTGRYHSGPWYEEARDGVLVLDTWLDDVPEIIVGRAEREVDIFYERRNSRNARAG